MAILPLLFNLADELTDYSPSEYKIFDDDFGFGIYPQEIRRVQRSPRLYLAYPQHKHRPYSLARKKSGGKVKQSKNVQVGKDGFQVCMDVAQFKPNELTVKTVDNTIVVEGKHEEREDEYGFISRHFIRKYSLPKGFDAKDVVSTLSSDGILTVKAPSPPSGKGNEREIQIQETGPAHLSVKDNPKEGEQNGDAANDEKMED